MDIYIQIHISKTVLGFKDKITVKFRNYDKNLPWRLWRGSADSREAIALCKKLPVPKSIVWLFGKE